MLAQFGKYTDEILKHTTNSELLLFEPQPELFESYEKYKNNKEYQFFVARFQMREWRAYLTVIRSSGLASLSRRS